MTNYSLAEAQFSLDGYVFGSLNDPVVILTKGFQLGGYEVRSQDVASPVGDYMMFGRDRHTPGEWTFELGIRSDTDVYPVLAELTRAWRADAVRSTPGAQSVLAYCRNGQTRLVYGRPRRCVPEPEETWDHEWKLVTATFQLADGLSYAGTESSLTLNLITTVQGGGLVLPATLPWALNGTTSTRAGIITNPTTIAAPFAVTIYGPIAQQADTFRLTGPGWMMGVDTVLGPSETLSIDTRTGVVRKNGIAISGNVRGSNYRAKLDYGPQELTFSANDPTSSSYATITWRDVSPTL